MSGLGLLEEVDDAVLIVDQEGVVIDANRAALRDEGIATIGARLWDLVPPERVSQRKFILSEVLASGRSVRFVDRVANRWTEVDVHPWPGGDGLTGGVVFVYRDVDARIEAEEEIKRLRLRVLTIQEDERRAISQDLHDELGQGMTALLLQIRLLADEPGASPDLRRRVHDATVQVETITKRMRQIFYRLRPPPLHSMPLREALRDYCASFSQASRLRIDFHDEEDAPAVDGPSATALYRLLQECLNNVAKHAHATSVWVNLSPEDGAMTLSVEDDGQGFAHEAAPDAIGLNGIGERFAMLGGEVRIESEPGRGTRVSGDVPLEPVALDGTS